MRTFTCIKCTIKSFLFFIREKYIYSKNEIEVINRISETIEILDNNYGANRNIDNNLGGYVLIVENIVDIEILKQDRLQGLVLEYTDVVEYSEEVNWTP